jgi:CTP:molybdopterin cytidylyltransferase MocA
MDAGVAGPGAVVLAAGAGTRFGGGKLLAHLEGRPMLQHVLDELRELALGCCVVVLGRDAGQIERRIDWRDEVRVVNPAPETGLAGSLRIGVAACLERLPHAPGLLVALGDQPRTSAGVMRALVAAIPEAHRAGAWAVVPAYVGGGGANPVLLLPAGLRRVPGLDGDRGMGALLAAHPGRAYRVPVPGANPDVDTPADLEALADPGRGGEAPG